MAHVLVTMPGHDRARSLGNLAAEWIEYHYVHGVGDIAYEPYELDQDFYEHLLDAYALNVDGYRLYSVVLLCRPKGCAKSELTGAVSLFESAGPCRFDGWAKGGEVYEDAATGFRYEYQPGEPMGRKIKSPRIRFMATDAEQVGESYDNVILNLTMNGDAETEAEQPPLWRAWRNLRDFFAGLSKTVVPGGGTITPVATGASGKDGGKDTLTVADEVHLYTQPRQVKAVHALARNLLKRKKASGWLYCTTTMHQRGAGSLGEELYLEALAIMAGDQANTGMLYDHREGDPVEDLDDAAAVEASLREAYAGREWINYEGYVLAASGGAKKMGGPEEFRRYFLNQEVSSASAFMASDEVARAHYLDDETKVSPLQPGEVIALGFDFAPGTKGGKTIKRLPDSTALIACRIADMSLHIIDLQEAPVTAVRDGWAPSIQQVEAAIDDAFNKYSVAAFYADPSHIQSYLATWAVKYGAKVKVRARPHHPFEFYMGGKSTGAFSQRINAFYEAVTLGKAHIVEDLRLVRHFLNARRHVSKFGVVLYKETPESPNKIDACVAGIIAYAAAMDCYARGITGTTRRRRVMRRLR